MPSVLIQDITPRDQYTAAAAQTVFGYSFTLFDERDIEVYKRADKDVEADDYSQQLQLNINYTVDLTASTITLLVACSGEEIVTLVRNMPDERLNLYINGAVITADALNTDQESQVLMIQQNSLYDTVLTPHYNKSDIIDDTNPLGGDVILPVLKAGQTWAKDATNNFIEAVNIGSGGGGGDVQMLDPGMTGAVPGSLARWNSSGVLTDSVVNIDDTGSITGATDATIGNIRIGVTDPNTIDTAGTNPLTVKAAAGQLLTLGELGANTALNGLTLPTADGTAGQVITTDGAGNLSFANSGGGAPFASTKYNLVQFSNTTGGLQDSGIDYQGGVLSGMTQVNVGNLELSGNTIAAGDTNGSITLAPDGTGAVKAAKELEIQSGNDLRLFRTNNANYVGFKAGSPAANLIWTLPDTDGAAGEALTTDGAGNLIWSNSGGGSGGGNWVQVGTTTAASSATVDLVGVFSSTYTRYMIVGRNITFQTTGEDFLMVVGTGATPTWKTGAGAYIYSSVGLSSDGTTFNLISTGATAIKLTDYVNNSTTVPTSLIAEIFDPANVAYKTPIMFELSAADSITPDTTVSANGSGTYKTAEAVSSIRFLASSGNIVTGVFEVYGFNPAGGGGGGSIPSNVVQNVLTTIQSGASPIFGNNTATNTTITPSSATSRIKVTFSGSFTGPGNQTLPAGFIFMYRNGSLITVSGRKICTKLNPLNSGDNIILSYIDSPATTSPVTYSIGAEASPGYVLINDSLNGLANLWGFPTCVLEEIGPA
jgi:hypothetical protein